MTDDWLDDMDLLPEDVAFDEELREHLRASLDAVGPTKEAEDRMLANLLAAQAAKDAEEAEVPVVVAPIELPDADNGGFTLLWGKQDKTTRRPRRWMNLAAAASLAAVAIGASVMLSLHALHPDTAATSMAAEEVAYETSAVEESGSSKNVYEDAEASEFVELEEVDDASAPLSASEQSVGEETLLDAYGGAFDETADPSYEYATTYPEVRLYSGEVLHIVEHDGGPVIIAEEWIEGQVGEAEAFTEDGFDSMKCWVYRLPVSDDGLFVVRYVEDGSAFAIRLDE